MKNDFGSRAQGSKGKRNDFGSKLKSTMIRELQALIRKEMTLGQKLKTTLGRELWALNGK